MSYRETDWKIVFSTDIRYNYMYVGLMKTLHYSSFKLSIYIIYSSYVFCRLCLCMLYDLISLIMDIFVSYMYDFLCLMLNIVFYLLYAVNVQYFLELWMLNFLWLMASNLQIWMLVNYKSNNRKWKSYTVYNNTVYKKHLTTVCMNQPCMIFKNHTWASSRKCVYNASYYTCLLWSWKNHQFQCLFYVDRTQSDSRNHPS